LHYDLGFGFSAQAMRAKVAVNEVGEKQYVISDTIKRHISVLQEHQPSSATAISGGL
jgi:hypothetical protein